MLSIHCEGWFRNLLSEHKDWYVIGTEKIYSKAGVMPTSLLLFIFYVSNNHKDSKSVTCVTLSETGLSVSGVGKQVMIYEEIVQLTKRYGEINNT